MKELSAGNQSDVRQDKEAVLEIGELFCDFRNSDLTSAPFTAPVKLTYSWIVVCAGLEVHTGDEAVAESTDDTVVGRADETAVVATV